MIPSFKWRVPKSQTLSWVAPTIVGWGLTSLLPQVATSFEFPAIYGLKTIRQLLSHSCPYFQLQITWLYLFCMKKDVLCSKLHWYWLGTGYLPSFVFVVLSRVSSASRTANSSFIAFSINLGFTGLSKMAAHLQVGKEKSTIHVFDQFNQHRWCPELNRHDVAHVLWYRTGKRTPMRGALQWGKMFYSNDTCVQIILIVLLIFKHFHGTQQ